MAVDVGSAVGYLDLDISGFLAGLKSAQNEADKQSKNIATKIGSNISGVGKSLTSVGTTLTKNVTVPLLGIGAAGLKVATDFEKGMSEVKAISGATGTQFDALREKAIELGADTAFSAGEVASAMTEMAKAGWTSQQIIDGMSGVLSAAAASGEGLATVATIVADAITGFGLEAKESTRIADLLTQAANSGTIGIVDLGESFKYIAPVAGAMGLSVEDVTTALSAMSMAGIKGSQAGTSLRTMLTRLVKPNDAVAVAMEKLGIEVSNADGTMKSLDEIVSILRKSFDGLTESEKAKYAATLAGQEGMAGLLALLNLTEEEYNEIAKSMDNATGVAENTAKVMQDNLQSKIEQLGGSLESLAIKLGDYVIPHLQDLVLWLTSLVDKFTNLDPEAQKAILKFAGITAAIGPVLLILGKLVIGTGNFITTVGKIPGAVDKLKVGMTGLTNGLKNIGEGFTAAKAGFGGLATQAGGLGTKIGVAAAGVTGPMIAIAAVVAIVIAAFVSLWKNNEEFRNKVMAIWDQIKASFEKLTSGIVERLNKLGFDFSSITDVIKAIWEGFCNFLAPIFEGVFQNIAIVFETVVNVILGIWDFFYALFTGDWEGCWTAVKTIFESIWNGIKDWFSNILNVIKGIFDVVLGWFGTSWSECWESIKTVFTNIWTSITTFLSTAWETIKNAVQVGIMFIVELIKAAFLLITLPFQFIWQNCKEYVIGFVEDIKKRFLQWRDDMIEHFELVQMDISEKLQAIKDFFSTIWNAIKTAVTNVLNSIKTTITNIFNSIKTTATNIWNGIKDAISGPLNTAKTTVTNVINSIKSYISTGLNSAKSTVTNIFNSIKTTINNIMNSAKTIVQNAINSIKSKFNFSWSLPKLKLPHPRITGSFSLNPPSVPSFSIEWYKKAMGNGMILDTATIFGFNSKTGKFLAGGEAGSEVVVGTKSLLSMIKQAVYDAVGPLVLASHELAKASAELGYVTYNGFTKFKETKERQKGTNPSNDGDGDTFIFYSPKSIDEVEAARQMKKTKRELAEGF